MLSVTLQEVSFRTIRSDRVTIRLGGTVCKDGQSADFGNFHHPANPRRLSRSACWCIFVEREMSSKIFVVLKIAFQDTAQSGFLEDDDVIQAFATNGAD